MTDALLNESELQFGKALTDEDLRLFFWKCLNEADEVQRREWLNYYRMYGGKTLSDADKTWMDSAGRLTMEANFALGVVNTVVGMERADRKEVQFSAEGIEHVDSFVAQWMTTLLRQMMSRSKGHRQETETHEHQVVVGSGFAFTYMDTSKVPVRPGVVMIPPWEVYPDPAAHQANYEDARWFIWKRSWTVEEAQATWPRLRREIVTEAAGLSSVMGHAPQHANVFQEVQGDKAQRIDIYHFEYVRYEPWISFVDPADRRTVSMPADEFKDQRELYEQQGYSFSDKPQVTPISEGPGKPVIRLYEFSGKSYWTAHIAAHSEASDGDGLVLENARNPIPSWMLHGVTAFREHDPDRGRTTSFGLGRVMFDAARYINASFRVLLEILARGAKGGGWYEKGVISDTDDFDRQVSAPGAWVEVKPGALVSGRIKERPAQPIPSGLAEFIRMLTSLLADLTGVTDYLKGTATQERSNVLISNLQQRSAIMLSALTDPMDDFRMRVGTAMMRLGLEYMPDHDINKMLGEVQEEGLTHSREVSPEGEEVWTPLLDEQGQEITPASILRGVDPLEYDVAVDVGQASTTHRQSVWALLVQTNLLGVLLEQGIDIQPIIPELLRYLPLPPTVAKKLGDKLEKQLNQTEAFQDPQAIMQALMTQPPDLRYQLVQQVMQATEQEQQAQMGAQGGGIQ